MRRKKKEQKHKPKGLLLFSIFIRLCMFILFFKKILWQVCFYSLFCSQLLPLLGIIYIKFRGEKLEKYSTYLIPIDMNFII